MNLNISIKKITCFLLAVLMLLAAVGCKETDSKTKKKKVVKKKVIIVNKVEDDDVESDDDIEIEEEEEESVRPTRPLPEVSTTAEKYVEPIIPEFDYEYATFDITSDYVIVYALDSWNNRYEGKNGGINGTPISVTSTANNRVSANDIKTYFKDNYNLNLPVVADTDPIAASATKKILVGDTIFYKTNLSEKNFAVKINGQDLIFEGGHFAMVEKAVKWYQTVEIKEGKVATLKGKETDFASTVTLENGITYNYVWGDEHDGKEIYDSDKWSQIPHKNDNDLTNIFNDERFNAVENGRMRLTGDRYYDESDPNVGYAISGATQTSESMLFRNGYIEFRARLPYTRGAFPAIWTMSTSTSFDRFVPNYDVDDGYGVYKNRVWNIEFDLFESFADTDHMTTTIHKWYTTIENYKNDNGKKSADVILDFGNGERINIFDKLKFPTYNLDSSIYTVAYTAAYSNINWTYKFANPETLNNEYHTYAYLYTQDHVNVYIDGNKFLDFDWDPNYDYINGEDVSRNNNGVGMNLWHYFIYDMMMYTPVKYGSTQPEDKLVSIDNLPLSMYVDYVRLYQDLDDPSMALCYPAAQQ